MRRIMLVMVLSLALIFGHAAVKSLAQEMTSQSGRISEVGKLLGTTVKDSQGEHLGIITDVAPGPEGRAAFAVLSYWISDDTLMRVAVPFGALSCQEQNCVLNASRDALGAAPTFVSEDNLAERKRAEDIYRYFGAQPYWTEE